MLKILAWKTWYVRYLCARSVASILSIEHIKMNYDFSQNSTLPGSTKFRKDLFGNCMYDCVFIVILK